MKISTLVALASIVGATALPAMSFGQGRGKGNSKHGGGHRDSGHRDNGNNKNRGRGNAFGVYKKPSKGSGRDDRRWDDRRGNDGRWDDRRRDDRRFDDRRRTTGGSSNFRTNGTSLQQLSDRRQQTKNEWRNIAIASGALAVYGLLKKDNTLTFAGAAGALYSLNRYEQDRRSQSAIDRARASYFSRPYFVRDGARFNRRTMIKNGQKHYQFVRAR